MEERFNPRAREGRDFVKRLCAPSLKTVSIHAPARGATLTFGDVSGMFLFQSTRPRGARPRHRRVG